MPSGTSTLRKIGLVQRVQTLSCNRLISLPPESGRVMQSMTVLMVSERFCHSELRARLGRIKQAALNGCHCSIAMIEHWVTLRAQLRSV